MARLVDIAPNFVSELESALESEGHGHLKPQVRAAEIDRCTYDKSVNAGYIYLRREEGGGEIPRPATLVAETAPFLHVGFNVDLDHNGDVLGIELLGRDDIFSKLRASGAL
jgi:hypothetical protein